MVTVIHDAKYPLGFAVQCPLDTYYDCDVWYSVGVKPPNYPMPAKLHAVKINPFNVFYYENDGDKETIVFLSARTGGAGIWE